MERLIKIDESGNLIFLYDDLIPWKDLGRMECERASDVVFDAEAQGWVIVLKNGERIGSIHAKREDAVAEEVKILEEQIASGCT